MHFPNTGAKAHYPKPPLPAVNLAQVEMVQDQNFGDKNMMKKLAIISLMMTVAASSFAGSLSDYPNYQNLLNNDNVVLYSYWGCLDDGYTQSDSQVNPIYYFIPPEGDHVAATVTITLNRSAGGQSLTTDYVYIKVEILDDSQGNVTVGTVTIERETVY